MEMKSQVAYLALRSIDRESFDRSHFRHSTGSETRVPSI